MFVAYFIHSFIRSFGCVCCIVTRLVVICHYRVCNLKEIFLFLQVPSIQTKRYMYAVFLILHSIVGLQQAIQEHQFFSTSFIHLVKLGFVLFCSFFSFFCLHQTQTTKFISLSFECVCVCVCIMIILQYICSTFHIHTNQNESIKATYI